MVIAIAVAPDWSGGAASKTNFVLGVHELSQPTPTVVFATTDGGQSFSTTPVDPGSSAIWASQNFVFTLANVGLDYNGSAFDGVIYRSPDGVNWIPVHRRPGYFRGIWGTDSGSVIYVVGDSGLVLQSLDGGLQWEPVNVGTTNRLHGVWGSSETDVYVVGDDVVIHGQ